MKRWKFAAGLLLVLAAGGVALHYAPSASETTVRIFYGSEKDGFLADPEVRERLRKHYGLTLDGRKMGSLEMSEADIAGIDGVWPSSGLAAQVFRQRHPGLSPTSHNLFSTPIVFFSWPEVSDALVRAGIVEARENRYYVIRLREFLDMVREGRPWKDLGLERQNGPVSLHATDPTRSNSGFLTAGLFAVILNDGLAADADGLTAHLEDIRRIFRNMGFLESSTGFLFDKYLNQGQGAYPVVAAYESLIIEFYRAYPRHQEMIRKRTRVLIPEPTVWSEHPFLALTESGTRLLAALQDPEIQKIAWERFGFRSGVMGIENDPGVLAEVGLPERIESVTPLPPPDVMDRILAALR
jgi:hypothetical protein